MNFTEIESTYLSDFQVREDSPEEVTLAILDENDEERKYKIELFEFNELLDEMIKIREIRKEREEQKLLKAVTSQLQIVA